MPSTLDALWKRIFLCQYGLSALLAMTGPRSEPPMPMLTMSVSRLPVWPRILRACTLPTKSSIALSVSQTSVTPSVSSATRSDIFARNAVCSTERSSVTLILSPANIASIAAGTSASRASRTSSFFVVALR